MGEMSELYQVTSQQAIEFFYFKLKEKVPSKGVGAERLFVASMLAHFAQVSCADRLSSARTLSDVFDVFVFPTFTKDYLVILGDPEILEAAGAQTLFLVGFFRDHMERRHSISFYDNLGTSFFQRASKLHSDKKRASLNHRVARNFVAWATVCRDMWKDMREERYVIQLDS